MKALGKKVVHSGLGVSHLTEEKEPRLPGEIPNRGKLRKHKKLPPVDGTAERSQPDPYAFWMRARALVGKTLTEMRLGQGEVLRMLQERVAKLEEEIEDLRLPEP